MALRITNGRIRVILGIVSLAWGSSSVAGRIGLNEGIPPPTMAAGATLVATVAVWLMIAIGRRGTLIGPAEIRIGLVLAVVSVLIPQQTRYLALSNASAGFVTLIGALVPIVTALLAHFALSDEPMTRATTGGLLIGLAGAAALILIGDSGISGGAPAVAGVASLLGVMSVAAASVYAKKHAGSYSVLGVTGVQLMVGSVAQWVIVLMTGAIPDEYSVAGIGAVLYAGVIGTFLPLSLYYFLIRHVTVVFSSVIAYLIPLVAVVAGVVILDERLEPGIIVGGALVMGSVVVTDLARIRQARGARRGAGPVG